VDQELPPARSCKELSPTRSRRQRAATGAGRGQGAATAVDVEAGEQGDAEEEEAVAGDYSGQPQPGVVEPGAPFLAAGAWKPTATTWLSRVHRVGAAAIKDMYSRTYFSQPQRTPTR
jgi:hypothetical protein